MISVPDEFAGRLIPNGQEPSRAALEALALDAYRERRMTGFQLRSLLGISSRSELDTLLKDHKIEKYTADDFDHDLATIRDLQSNQQPKRSV